MSNIKNCLTKLWRLTDQKSAESTSQFEFRSWQAANEPEGMRSEFGQAGEFSLTWGESVFCSVQVFK
jgi:hypothetical protein